MICYKCEKSFNRDNNIYGTYCPYCNSFIKPINIPKFVEKIMTKKEILQAEMLEKLREKIKRKN